MTFTDILDSVLMETKNQEVPDLMAVINRTVQALARRRNWKALATEYQAVLEPAHSAGTVAVTKASTAVTGTDTAWTAAMAGRQFRVSGNAGVFTVASYVSPTQITLDRAYPYDDEAGASYSIYQDRVTLPADFKHMLAVRDADQGVELQFEPWLGHLMRTHLWGVQPRDAQCYTIAGQSGGQYVLVLPEAPVNTKTLEIHYYRKPAEINDPGDAIDLPADLHDVVLKGVVRHYLSRLASMDPADPMRLRLQEARREEEDALNEAAKQDAMRASTSLYHARTNF